MRWVMSWIRACRGVLFSHATKICVRKRGDAAFRVGVCGRAMHTGMVCQMHQKQGHGMQR